MAILLLVVRWSFAATRMCFIRVAILHVAAMLLASAILAFSGRHSWMHVRISCIPPSCLQSSEVIPGCLEVLTCFPSLFECFCFYMCFQVGPTSLSNGFVHLGYEQSCDGGQYLQFYYLGPHLQSAKSEIQRRKCVCCEQFANPSPAWAPLLGLVTIATMQTCGQP